MTVEEIQERSVKSSIDISRLLKEPIGARRTYDIAETIDEQASHSIWGTITLTNAGDGILIQGKLNAELELTCSRCLNTFLYTLHCSVEEEFLSTSDIAGGREIPSPEGSSNFTLDNSHLFDLGELVCQYILLNLPMKLLCKPDCTGIRR